MRKKFYCSRQCQKEAWSEHKRDCLPKDDKTRTKTWIHEQCVIDRVKEHGWCILLHRTGPCVVMIDENGQFHESLSDQDVTLVTKELLNGH